MLFLFFLLFVQLSNSRNIPEGYYHSDAIVTKWPAQNQTSSSNPPDNTKNEPGWVRTQLLKFGRMASKIGNAMGAHASKISAALDKICEVIKAIIPLLAAVCHVGQFGFCFSPNDAPNQIFEAMNPSDLDLDTLDK